MKQREYKKAELGILLGVAFGGTVATVMFAITSNPLWFGFVGFGVAVGLGIGAALDRNHRSTKTNRRSSVTKFG